MAEKAPSNLAVLTFEGQDTAEALYEQIEKMAKDKLLILEDAVIIERTPTYDAPSAADSTVAQMHTPPIRESKEQQVTVKQTRGKKGKYAAIGGGIGLLAGALLGGPIGLLAVGAASLGAITAAMKDFGIDDASITAIKQRLQPNTSALLLLGHANDREALLAKLREYDAKVVMTSLDPEVERELVATIEGRA